MKKEEINTKNKKKNTYKEVEVEKEINVAEEDTDIIEKKEVVKKSRVMDYILIGGLVLVVALGAFLMKDNKEKITYELPLTLTGDAGLHQLTYSEYQEKIDNLEEFVLILERATCSHCVTYMPIAEKFAEDNDVPMYYVDTDTFTNEDWTKFERSNSYIRKSKGNWGTPTTIVLVGDEVLDYIEGVTSEDELFELYDEYFEIEEREN